MNGARRLRLGIDVGGTFTDVVAIDVLTRALVASVKVPTTHDAPEGVAAGIVHGVERLLKQGGIDPAQVAFIAHSTTQATNALLEGDVARVGVVGLLDGFAPLVRAQIRFAPFELAPGAPFAPHFAFARGETEGRAAADALLAAGVQAIAASQAFSVDRPDIERAVVAHARERGAYATSGHEVSAMYGLRSRTRTAALNAAILPKMVRTAQMTQAAVQRAAIRAPLMIMRSDGGVMDVREIERRPLLTLLSGPAAGVAGALLHENVTDAIFIEVGGTSADCSAIRGGMPQMRPARVGGHRTMLRTLDVRTLAVAGGSMLRVHERRATGVGPRSAHIAGMTYASFTDPSVFEGARLELVAPTPHDPPDYAAIVARDGRRIALTPTCAANLLGFVPEDAFARANAEAAQRGFALLGAYLGCDAASAARRVLDLATDRVVAAVDELAADYGLDCRTLVLVGGGGGAAALVPYAARRSGLEFRLARDAEVISPIGVALALVREVVERTIVDPGPEDIVRIRREAQDAVVAAGAAADRVEVAIEIDPQRNLVRATASGAGELSEASAHGERSMQERLAAAARAMNVDAGALREIESTGEFVLVACERRVRGRFGRTSLLRDLRVVDTRGVVRLGLRDARVVRAAAQLVPDVLLEAIESATAFGDVGRALPRLYLLHGARIADLSGLASAVQAVALAREELAGRASEAPVLIVTAPNHA